MRTRGSIWRLSLPLILLTATYGCVTSTGELRKLEERLDFAEPGETSRQAFIETFGEPTASYEDGRLVVYVFTEGQEDPETSMPRPAEFIGPHLVLEFDEHNVLKRYRALVPP